MIIFNNSLLPLKCPLIIIGFLRECRPVIAIHSSHMSRSYGDALFSATSYDVNDNMFLVAYGVMSSENYEDLNWFLQNLKDLIGDKMWSFYRMDT